LIALFVSATPILPLSDDYLLSRLLFQSLALVLVGGWLIHLLRTGSGLPATALNRHLLFLFGVYVFATVLSAHPRYAAEGLWQMGIFLLLLLMCVDTLRQHGINRLIQPLMLAAAIVALMCLLDVVAWYFGLSFPLPRLGWLQIGGLEQPVPPYLYQAGSSWNLPPVLSAYDALLIPVGLGYLISARSRDTRIGMALWVIGLLAAEIFTFSRGGYVSLGVSIPIFAVLSMPGGASDLKRILTRFKGWHLAAAASTAGLLIILAVWGWSRQNMSGHIAGDEERLDLWRSALEIGRDHPLSGVGPLGFGRALRSYRTQGVVEDRQNSPHNILLLTLSEAGVPGVIALLAVVTGLGLTAYRRWRAAEGVEKTRIAGVIAGLVGFSAHNMVDTFLSLPVMLPVLVLCAVLLVPPVEKIDAGRRRWLAPVAALAALLVSAIGWGVADLAQFHHERAVQAGRKGDLAAALAEINLAVQIDPALGLYPAQRAQFVGRLMMEGKASLAETLAAYQAALADDSTYEVMLANESLLLNASGDSKAALARMEQAHVFNPNDPDLALWLGDLRAAAGDTQGALNAYAMALKHRPAWIESGYWETSALRQQARHDFLAAQGLEKVPLETLVKMQPDCWITLRPAGDSEKPSAYCEAEFAYFVEGNSTAALEALNRALLSDRMSTAGYLLRARITLERADLSAAERDARTARFLGAETSLLLGQLAVARGDLAAAEREHLNGVPVITQNLGWELALYGRRGDFSILPLLDTPGPGRNVMGAWAALADLYDLEGRGQDARNVREAILHFDPYYPITP
jgi:tetratricopeptide (TPR) repeat protein